MHKYLEKKNEVNFDKIFNQTIGYILFKDFCENACDEPVPQLKFYEEVRPTTWFFFLFAFSHSSWFGIFSQQSPVALVLNLRTEFIVLS